LRHTEKVHEPSALIDQRLALSITASFASGRGMPFRAVLFRCPPRHGADPGRTRDACGALSTAKSAGRWP
jgi:hypothetical protein